MKLHPWNTDFSWTLPVGPYRVLTEDQATSFERDGFTVLPDAFSPAELAPVIEATDEHEAQTDAFLQTLDNERMSIAEAGAITFSINLVTRSPLLRRFSHHPLLVGLAHDVLGPDVNMYWDQAVYKKPEKPRRFPWHQDNGYTVVDPQAYLTCWIALTDATVDNGCPHVVPGVHRAGTLAHTYIDPLGWECFADPPAEPVTVEVQAGSVVAFTSLTPHMTGPNTTDAVRKAYIVQYAPLGAVILGGDLDGPPTERRACDDPARHYAVVRGGQPVGDEGL